MASLTDFIVDDSGYRRPVIGAEVYLLDADGSLAAADSPNPTLTDDFGAYTFMAQDAVYTVEARLGGVTIARGTVTIGVPPDYVGPRGPKGEGLDDVKAPGGAALLGFTAAGSGSVSRTVAAAIGDTALAVTAKGADPTAAASSSAAFNTALAEARTVRVPKGDYLLTEPFTIPTGASLEFDAGARLLAGLDGMTMINVAGFTYNASFRNVRIDNNGKSGVTGMALSNFRHRAIIDCPEIYGCEVGIDLSQLCWDTVLMFPWIRSTRFPLKVRDGSNALDVYHPALDGYERGIIAARGPTHDTVNVRVQGGYIQNGYVGIEDNGTVGLIVDGTYFEGNGCKATGSIAGTMLTVTEVRGGGGFHPGQSISGTDITPGTAIVEQLTGEKWKVGTYRVTISQTVASTNTLAGEGYDISLNGSLRPNISRTQHYSDFGGIAAIRGRNTTSATIFDPTMSNGSRSLGLFDCDDTNVNLTTFVQTSDLGGPNVPIGDLPVNRGVIGREMMGTFVPQIIGSGTAGVATYDPAFVQVGKYVADEARVTIQLQVKWTGHTGTGNLIIRGIPITMRPDDFTPARVGDAVAIGFPLTGNDNFLAFTGSGTDLNLQEVNSGTASLVALPASGTLYVNLTYNR